MIIVTDGGSRFGRQVVAQLLTRIPPRLVAVTVEDPSTVTDLAELGVDVRPHVFTDPAASARAFDGADSVLSNPPAGWTDHSPTPEQSIDKAVECARAAISTGVPRIVHRGVINNDMTSLLSHNSLENEIRTSGVPCTVLRHNLHAEALIPAVRLAAGHGVFVSAFGDRRIAPAAGRDYAEVTAGALLDGGSDEQVHGLSGRLAFSALGIASAISLVLDREVRSHEITQDRLIPELRRLGATARVAGMLADLSRFAEQGEFEERTDTMEQLLGHQQRSLVEALRDVLSEGGEPAPDQARREAARRTP